MELSEVRKHNTREDCWVIVHGNVYNLLDFIEEHPGGVAILIKYAGKDATKAFDPVHNADTLNMYLDKSYHLGPLKKGSKKAAKTVAATPAPVTKPAPKPAQAITTSLSSATAATAVDPVASVVDEFDVEYDTHESKLPLEFPSAASGIAFLSPAEAAQEDSISVDLDEDDEGDVEDPPDAQEAERRELVKSKPALSSLYNLHDFEFVARHVMEQVAWAYYSLGSDDEISLRENHFGFQRIFFQPRVLIDVSKVDYSRTMLGTKLSVPFFASATALGRLGHPEGETVMTRAAHDEGMVQMISTLALCSLDEIIDAAKDSQTQWLQVYVNSNRSITKRILQHAEKRGIKGFFITVDAPTLGRREKDMRSKNVEVDIDVQKGTKQDTLGGASRAMSTFIDHSLNWLDIAWFRLFSKVPIILKGIQTVADSLKAIEYGVDGIVLSNHGGRQLDYSKPPIEVLAELNPILREKGLKDKIEIFVDGGVRRGTDILKAICLGAKGVGIGRPFLYAMLAYGQIGVQRSIQILKEEIEMNMKLLGVNNLDELDETYIDFRNVGGTRFVAEDKMFDTNYEALMRPQFKGKL